MAGTSPAMTRESTGSVAETSPARSCSRRRRGAVERPRCGETQRVLAVMPALVAGIHALQPEATSEAWVAGASPAMMQERERLFPG